MDIFLLFFILIPARYSLRCLVGLFTKDKYSRKKLVEFKGFKGWLYITLTLISILDWSNIVGWLTISIAICEGLTNVFEHYTEKIEMNRENKLEERSMNQPDRGLKDKENILTDIRVQIDSIEKGLESFDLNKARKGYYEVEVMLRVYKEADILLKELKEVVFHEKKLSDIKKDKITKLYEEYEDFFIAYT